MDRSVQSSKQNPADVAVATLVSRKLLEPSSLARAEAVASERGARIDQILTGLGLVTDEALAEVYADILGLSLLGIGDLPAEAIEAEAYNAAFLERSRVLVARVRGTLALAMVDPLDDEAARAVRFIAKEELPRFVVTPRTFEAVFRSVFGTGKIDAAVDVALQSGEAADTGDALRRMEDMASEAPVVRLVNQLITEAIEARASDIHIEPAETGFRARMRVDGVLRDVPVPAISAAGVISRIKILAGLDIAERRLPQDGRMSLAIRGRDIDFRISTVPLMGGESVVMRILDRESVALDFEALGFGDRQVAALHNILSNPHGILLVTGPTGSGKTTTLYTALSSLNSPDRKVLTIEDPIEYQLPGINQSQVNTRIGRTFATALRTFLRQDPDVMMVGEIRDLETAEIAIQASLTGHLVLSTLHTNSAIGAIPRLGDLGAEDYLLSSTLIGLVAQRLVRRLCERCKTEASDQRALLARMPDVDADRYEGQVFHEAAGCEACNGAGFSGRLVIAEVLPVGEALRPLILRRAGEQELLGAAREAGFTTMTEDGVAKAAEGLTSLAEVMRVTQVY